MNPLEISIIIAVSIINFVLMGLIYTRQPQNVTHRLFSLLVLAINAYLITNFLSVQEFDKSTSLWLIRLTMFFATPMSVLFYFFVHNFPSPKLQMSKHHFFTWIMLMSLTMLTALSPFLFTDISISDGELPSPKPGPGMLLFAIVSVGSIPLGLILLFIKMKRAKARVRQQLQIILAGVALMFTMIIIFIFAGTVIFGNAQFVRLAPLFTLPFVGFTAYSMIRYRLMDIRLALFRGLSLLFLLGALLFIYGILVVFAVPIIVDLTLIRGEIIAAVAALISIPLARYIQSFLTKVTNRFLFQKPIDYQAELARISSDISGTIRIQDVTSIVIKNLTELVRTKKTVIFLQKYSGKHLVPRASSVNKNINVSIPTDHIIIRHLHHTGQLIIRDDIKASIEQQKSANTAQNLQEINGALNWLDAEVVLPLIVNKKITGIIIIGPKLTGEPYSKEDINFLKTLAPQAATALENARLYQESLEFGRKLKSEVEQATHELSLANEQLRDLDKSKSEFLSIASHQLNTPLTPLRGYLSMLLEGDYGKIPPQQKEIIQRLEKSSVQLISLIKNYLDLSRIESGRLELNLEKLDLAEMTDEIIKELTPNATNKKFAIKFNRPRQALPLVIGDREKLRQVILNLVDNAIKYTTQGGVEVSVNEDGGEVGVAVKDSGRGLAREEITRLFTKFTRVGGKDKYRAEGTGLGLFVAKQIVEEHHGRVSVTSPGKGQGSTFAISLPAANTSRSLKLEDKAGKK